MIYKTLHIKLKIEPSGVAAVVPEGYPVHVQLVASVGCVTRVSLNVANLNPFVNYVTLDIWMGNDLLIRNLHTYMKDLHSGKTN